MVKWALLAGVAMAATAESALADDLGALKGEIESLQTRVSELEAQPKAALPSGYSLLSIRDGQGVYQGLAPEAAADRVRDESGFTLSVLPAADAAPQAEVSVSGEIRTVLLYQDEARSRKRKDDNEDNLDMNIRARIFVKAKVDTAVGEVGSYFRFQADGGGDFNDYSENTKLNKAYAWWKFAPEWQLLAGYWDNTATIQAGWDFSAATGPTLSFGPNNVTNEQLRLTYTTGPVSVAIAVEDPDFDDNSHRNTVPNFQSYVMYKTDAFTGQVVGLYQIDDESEDDWALGAGALIALSDAFKFAAAGVLGEGTSSFSQNLKPATVDDEFWMASAAIIADLSESVSVQLGAGIEDWEEAGQDIGYGFGVYWDPVSQVTVGAGATYVDYNEDAGKSDTLQVFVGTWLRFP